jgi:Spy/CpxP family protein refolding chaperone
MKRETTRSLSMILVLATAFLSSGIAAAQGRGGRVGGSLVPPQRLLERLGITDPGQLEEINNLKEAAKAALGLLQEEQKEYRQQVRTLLESEAPDPVDVGNIVIWTHNLGEEIKAARQSFREQFELLLTSEQLLTLEEFSSNRHGRRGSRRGFRRGRDGSPEGEF